MIKDYRRKAMEELAAKVAWTQDSGYNPFVPKKEKGDTTITIPTYIRHHIHTEPNGHDIIIVSGEPGKEKLMTIQCRWPDRQRDASGRVHDK